MNGSAARAREEVFPVETPIEEVKHSGPAAQSPEEGGGSRMNPIRSLSASPAALVPADLLKELRAFYRENPDYLEGARQRSPAQFFDKDQLTNEIERFCDWAIGEGWGRRTYSQINGRLGRWFKDIPLMNRTPSDGGDAAPKEVYRAPKNMITRNPHSTP